MSEGILRNKNKKVKDYRKAKLFILLFFAVLISMFLGRYGTKETSIATIIYDFKNLILGNDFLSSSSYVIYNIRLPRIILSISVGSILSISGLIFQKVFRNPIASPDILGITSGASFGAALGILIPKVIVGQVQLFAFIFGAIAILAVFKIRDMSSSDNILYLVLSGMIVSSFFTAMLSIMKYMADPFEKLPSIVFWTMGGLYKANWFNALLIGIIALISILLIEKLSYKIDILSLDDEEALTLGIDVEKMRKILLISISLIVSLCVCISGTIGWIALIVPHIVKSRFEKTKDIFIMTPICGALILLFLDNISRTMTTSEIPVGILTALIGAPILGYFIIFRKVV
jgi:iron complex transport system permease protein